MPFEMRYYTMNIVALLIIVVLTTGCSGNNPDVAALHTKKCLLEPTESGYTFNKLILYPGIHSKYNKEIKLPVSRSNDTTSSIDICNFLSINKIDINEIGLIYVEMLDAKKDTRQFVIDNSVLRLIGKDTIVLFQQSIE